ncbi:MAG: spondin domain-containing protein [Vicinamibacterales bacterium]
MNRLFLALLLTAATACSGAAESPTVMMAPSAVTAPGSPPPSALPAATARYRVVFDSTWTRSTHPQDAPDNPHYSALIGVTHHSGVTFWLPGSPATEGIRRMAESGVNLALDTEIRAAIASAAAKDLLLGSTLDSPGTTSFEFEVSQTHPLVTLVTMVAPSPDWFVGVSGLPMFENGAWIEQRVMPLAPWDAGTDSGATFRAADIDTRPRQPISLISTPPLAINGTVSPLGIFTFMRLGS